MTNETHLTINILANLAIDGILVFSVGYTFNLRLERFKMTFGAYHGKSNKKAPKMGLYQ